MASLQVVKIRNNILENRHSQCRNGHLIINHLVVTNKEIQYQISIKKTHLTVNIGQELGTLQRIYQSDMQYEGTDSDFNLCLKNFDD